MAHGIFEFDDEFAPFALETLRRKDAGMVCLSRVLAPTVTFKGHFKGQIRRKYRPDVLAPHMFYRKQSIR